jgi:glyoxylase-like metal-dependent hydrolase (beta-lactamase superfamily II)
MLDHADRTADACACCAPALPARRTFLRCIAGAGAAAALPGAALAQAGAAPGQAGAVPVLPQLAQAAAPGPVREITRIAGNVWRFRNNFHFSVFAVTRAGIVATDPINADAARWLQGQLRERFPGQPVRYLIYSHDHADHISGGEVFEGATVIAHENAKAKIVGERRPTAVPTATFRDALSIQLGDTAVELAHVGRNHSDNSIVMRFPAERVLFAVDFIPVETLAFRDMTDGYLEEWIESLRRVEAMDFDILAPGHGPVGRKEHVRMFREYMQALYEAVLDGVRAGRSLDELKQTVRLERYAGWQNYRDYRELNIAGAHRYITLFRVPNP